MLAFWITLLLISGEPYSGIYEVTGSINDSCSLKQKVYYIKQGERLVLTPSDTNDASIGSPDSPYEWYIINPVLKEYSNYKNKLPGATALIEYKTETIDNSDSIISLDVSNYLNRCGTYYFACANKTLYKFPDAIRTALPLQQLFPYRIIQVVVREGDSYTGYLTELFNTPFILPPAYILGYGHQTDLRLGSDCAEFIIYGKRRQGFIIPYCGPKGIPKYLEKIDEKELRRGSIVHFGEQVSLFWDDNGILGKLDKEDMLLQSYDKTVYFTTVGNCGFFGRHYRLYKWKIEFEK